MTGDLTELLMVNRLAEANHFIGAAEPYPMGGIYGGHLLGQSLAAAFETVDPPKLADSMHAYFLRPGSTEQPIRYVVDRLLESTRSDVREVTAFQGERALYKMTARFKVSEEGNEHQRPMPKISTPENTKDHSMPMNPVSATGKVALKLASEPFIRDDYAPGRTPKVQMWFKVLDPAKPSERFNQCAIAFLSDSTLMMNSVIPHGLPFKTHTLTSIDHAVWFHRTRAVTDWLLFDQESTAAADGRGFNQGYLYHESGSLLAIATQESLLREQ